MKFIFTHHRPTLSFVILQTRKEKRANNISDTDAIAKKKHQSRTRAISIRREITEKSKKEHKDRERVHDETGGDIADRKKKPSCCKSFFSTHRLIPGVRQLTK